MTGNCSHYAKQKLENKFPLGEFVTPDGFLNFLRRHGLSVNKQTLERFEEEGWVQPVFRMRTQRLEPSRALLLDTVSLKENYENGLIEFTREGDYAPWNTLESNTDERVLIFYHPFQLLQVQSILKRKTVSFTNYDSYTKDDLYKIADSVKGPTLGDVFLNSRFDQADAIGLLMLLEEPYYFYIHRWITIQAELKRDEFAKSREAWKQPQISKQFLVDSGFSIEDVRKMRDHYESEARFADPLKRWRHLVGITRPSLIDELEGPAQLAQFYYKIIRALDAFIYDLTGERVEDTVDYSDHKIQSDIIERFTIFQPQSDIIERFINSQPLQLIILVEGKTEENIIKKIFENMDLKILDMGLEITNCGGIGNMNPSYPMVRFAATHHAAIYLIADCENRIKTQIQNIQASVNADNIEVGYRLWKKSFEDAHFDDHELLDYTNTNLPAGRKLEWGEVETERDKDIPMFSAMANAYYNKYCAPNDSDNQKRRCSVLEDAIGPKHEMALKLIEPKLTLRPGNTSPNTKIEKVVLGILNFLGSRSNPRRPNAALPQIDDCA